MDVDSVADDIENMFDGDLGRAVGFGESVLSELRSRRNARDFAEKEVGGD